MVEEREKQVVAVEVRLAENFKSALESYGKCFLAVLSELDEVQRRLGAVEAELKRGSLADSKLPEMEALEVNA
jgi:hypothetical protein